MGINLKLQTTVIGIDLAWGEKNPDGVCVFAADGTVTIDLVKGDAELFAFIATHQTKSTFLAIDAPLICRNEEGSRPVDRECSSLFRQYEAGCHPVNLNLCQRPLRVAENLKKEGYILSPALEDEISLQAAEVYPHPATIHFFDIDKTIKYKRGPVKERRKAFTELQSHLSIFISKTRPINAESVKSLLNQPWSKNIEDVTDALLCALIGDWHLRHKGKQTITLGDDHTGHILIPKRL